MPDCYRILYTGGVGELIEKKSRFIATLQPITTEEQAITFIEQCKKKYWDARHNCFAYTLGANHELERCSDDGEPSKTAGRPMLDVLTNEGIHDAVVVVTRYFGGVLLGTGGLVRAYQGAVKEGLQNCVIIEKKCGIMIHIITDYPGLGKIQYICASQNITIRDTQYSDTVSLDVLVPPELQNSFLKQVSEATNGKAIIHTGKSIFYSYANKEIIYFDA